MRADDPHPQVQTVLDQLEAMDVPNLSDLPVDPARDLFETMSSASTYRNGTVSTTDRAVETEGGSVPVRVYRPGDGDMPTTVFFHGGGFVVGSVETHDATCRALADLTDSVVVSVDYRLAPEHPFPAAVHDASAVTEWVSDNTSALGGTDELVVAGDSAGATLAAAVTLLSRDQYGPTIDYQVLFYPSASADDDWPSITDAETGLFLSAADMEWFGEQYLTDPLHAANPYAFPLEACSFVGLPPATVVTAGFDPLRDEGIAYADALEGADVPVVHRHHEDMVHGFVSMIGRVDRAESVIEAVGTDRDSKLAE
jgi:acetyl esterase